MAFSAGTLFQAFPITGTGGGGYHGCSRFATNALANSVDFSYLLDFQNGFLGGVIDPCNDPSSGPLFLDCENAGTGGGTTDTTTDTTTTDTTTNTTNG
jgi:hypothetical protein